MTTVQTTLGPVRGQDDGNVLRFAGLPFAAAPVGERRFRPPQPAEPWTEVRDATGFATIAPQNPDMLTAFLGMEQEASAEDCLYLNVWTPAADDARRPVMVWIHGGAFIIGSGSSPLYHGELLAERGDVVLVSVNYRLGELGFLELGWLDESYAGSANNGILDQVAALEWVRDNIAAFGGDPEQVTIFGESAGAMSVTALLAAPAAKGLFQRAIAQSGAAQAVATPEQAEVTGRDYLRRLGVETIDELLATPTADLLTVQAQLMAETFTNVGAMLEAGVAAGIPFRPVEDGRALPTSILAAIRAGSAEGVTLMVGTTADEWKLFALMDPQPITAEVLRARLAVLTGDADKALAVYGDDHDDPKDLFGALLTDMAFRVPAIQLAEAQLEVTPDVYMYVFSWGSPIMDGLLGACHAIELPFVFRMVDDPRLAMFLGPEPPEALADAVQAAWLAFGRTGRPAAPGLPDWPRYDTDRRATMDLNIESRVVDDPGADERTFWSSLA